MARGMRITENPTTMETRRTMLLFDLLPVEVWEKILTRVSLSDFLRLMSCCRRLRRRVKWLPVPAGKAFPISILHLFPHLREVFGSLVLPSCAIQVQLLLMERVGSRLSGDLELYWPKVGEDIRYPQKYGVPWLPLQITRWIPQILQFVQKRALRFPQARISLIFSRLLYLKYDGMTGICDLRLPLCFDEDESPGATYLIRTNLRNFLQTIPIRSLCFVPVRIDQNQKIEYLRFYSMEPVKIPLLQEIWINIDKKSSLDGRNYRKSRFMSSFTVPFVRFFHFEPQKFGPLNHALTYAPESVQRSAIAVSGGYLSGNLTIKEEKFLAESLSKWNPDIVWNVRLSIDPLSPPEELPLGHWLCLYFWKRFPGHSFRFYR